jgi:hypothetical protein
MHPGQPFGAAGWDANKKVFDEKHPHHEAAAGHHEAPAHH